MPQSSLMALPQDPPVPKDPIFGQTELQITLYLMQPSKRELLWSEETVRVRRNQMYPAPIFTAPSAEIHQVPEQDGQADPLLRTQMHHLPHLLSLLCPLSRAVCAIEPKGLMVMISGKSVSKPSKRKMLPNNASDVGCLDASKLAQRGLVTSMVRDSLSCVL